MFGSQSDACRKVFGQGLQLASQQSRQITAAVRLELQRLQQVALDVQSQRPGLAILWRKLQLTLHAEWPVALGFQQAIEVQHQRITLQVRAVDLQAFGGPVRCQLEIAQLFDAIQLQTAQLYITQLQRQR